MQKNSSINPRNDSVLLAGSLGRADGVAWCSAFAVVSLFTVVGNLLAVIVFALNRKLRKNSFLLVINMAFADLLLGAVSLPLFIYQLGGNFELWQGEWSSSLEMLYRIVDTVCAQSSIITAAFIAVERFYSIGWPLKHRSIATRRAYYALIALVWIFAVVISSAIIHTLKNQPIHVSIYIWMAYACSLMLIISGCYIGIWRKYKQGGNLLQAQNRRLARNNKRSTKTLLVITLVVLMSWLPLVITNTICVYVPVSHDVLLFVNLLNFSNSFANPVIYSLRIPEFRKALFLSARTTGKPSVARLAVTSTKIQLQVTLRHELKLNELRQEENKDEAFETETELLKLTEH